MDNITNVLTLIWYFIRDYHAKTYTLKQVCSVAAEKLIDKGYTVSVGNRGNISVNGIQYLIYKEKAWNSYDVRHIPR